MKTFRTEVPLNPSSWKIGHTYNMIAVGSCFAENIGQKLKSYKFKTLLNPFGIMYNPLTIAQNLSLLAQNKRFTREDVFQHNGEWHSFDHHGCFSNSDLEKSLGQINEKIQAGHSLLKKLDCLLVTLGSAHAFYDKETDRIVANCHKMPNAAFGRKLLKVEQIVENLTSVFAMLKERSPGLRIILTVSPVRYLRDGLAASNLSKSTLLLAVHELCSHLNYAQYFPAYELVTDDLRDYRFYEEDMAHPTKVAVDYVWDFFEETYFNRETKTINAKIGKLKAAMNHRPIHPGGPAHQRFMELELGIAGKLQKEFPQLDLREEVSYFSS